MQENLSLFAMEFKLWKVGDLVKEREERKIKIFWRLFSASLGGCESRRLYVECRVICRCWECRIFFIHNRTSAETANVAGMYAKMLWRTLWIALRSDNDILIPPKSYPDDHELCESNDWNVLNIQEFFLFRYRRFSILRSSNKSSKRDAHYLD